MAKRTLEELGKLEHALKQKFGEESIINPLQSWNKEKEENYKIQLKEKIEKEQNFEKNEEKIEKDGFLVSKRLLTYKNSESCPECKKYLTDTQDSVYLLKFECCQKCYFDYVDGREDRWKQGWRPSKNI